MKNPFRIRLTTNDITSGAEESCVVSQIVIGVANAGTAWKLKITDKLDVYPAVLTLVPEFTLTVPTDGKPIIMNFEQPVRMENGIRVVTSGTTPGDVSIWISFDPPNILGF